MDKMYILLLCIKNNIITKRTTTSKEMIMKYNISEKKFQSCVFYIQIIIIYNYIDHISFENE